MSPNGFKIRKSLPIISEFSERERKRERERERERESVCKIDSWPILWKTFTHILITRGSVFVDYRGNNFNLQISFVLFFVM